METTLQSNSVPILENVKMASPYRLMEEGAVKANLAELTAALSSDNPWAIRQAAAIKLGAIADPRALAELLEALSSDPFWMVRHTIIKVLEMIGDRRVTTALEFAAENDSFAVVRSYAAKAIETLRNS